jgi:hypothetical protein
MDTLPSTHGLLRELPDLLLQYSPCEIVSSLAWLRGRKIKMLLAQICSSRKRLFFVAGSSESCSSRGNMETEWQGGWSSYQDLVENLWGLSACDEVSMRVFFEQMYEDDIDCMDFFKRENTSAASHDFVILMDKSKTVVWKWYPDEATLSHTTCVVFRCLDIFGSICFREVFVDPVGFFV